MHIFFSSFPLKFDNLVWNQHYLFFLFWFYYFPALDNNLYLIIYLFKHIFYRFPQKT